MSEDFKNFYFTFGDDRIDKYVAITAKNEETARKIMFSECGRRWAFMYGEEDFMKIKEKYNMKLLFHFWEED